MLVFPGAGGYPRDVMTMHSQQDTTIRHVSLRGLGGRTGLTILVLVIASLAVTAHAQPRVVVSIEPYRDAVQRLLGDDVDVDVLLPPGASPHAYDPTPRQVAGLADADLVIVNGGLDGWVIEMVEALGGDVPVFVAMEALELGELIGGDHDHGNADERADGDAPDVPAGYGDVNPHVWLDPGHMRTIVTAIAGRLSELDPARAHAIGERSATYLDELAALDAEVADMLAPVAGAPFVPFHDAWPYFALHFGLDLIVEIEPFPGREPTARELAGAIDTIERTGAAAVFSEVQLAERAARVLADEAGVRLGVLDPIGGAPGRRSYAELLRYNAAGILVALRPDADRP